MRLQFNRLLRALGRLDGFELQGFVQHGHSDVSVLASHANVRVSQFATEAELTEAMEKAEVVIAHAGIGSILKANSLGKRLVICPRRNNFGEHVDDHQLQITAVLRGEGFPGVQVAQATPEDLSLALHTLLADERPVGSLIMPQSIQHAVAAMVDHQR